HCRTQDALCSSVYRTHPGGGFARERVDYNKNETDGDCNEIDATVIDRVGEGPTKNCPGNDHQEDQAGAVNNGAIGHPAGISCTSRWLLVHMCQLIWAHSV